VAFINRLAGSAGVLKQLPNGDEEFTNHKIVRVCRGCGNAGNIYMSVSQPRRNGRFVAVLRKASFRTKDLLPRGWDTRINYIPQTPEVSPPVWHPSSCCAIPTQTLVSYIFYSIPLRAPAESTLAPNSRLELIVAMITMGVVHTYNLWRC